MEPGEGTKKKEENNKAIPRVNYSFHLSAKLILERGGGGHED